MLEIGSVIDGKYKILNVIGKGGGRSKKDAEQQAAREALELMGY